MSSEPFFSRLKILKLDNSPLLFKTSHLILSFALLGYVDVAARLTQKLNAYDKLHGQDYRLRPLWFLWDLLGDWPEGEEERVKDAVRERRRKSREGGGGEDEPAAKQKKVEKSEEEQDAEVTAEDIKAEIDEWSGQYARSWFYPVRYNVRSWEWRGEEGYPHQAQAHTIPDAVKREEIEKILKSIDEIQPQEFKDAMTGAMAMDVSSGLVSALDLALSLNSEPRKAAERETTPEVDEVVSRIAKRMSANQQIEYLTQSRRAWRFFRSGALCKALNLDTSKLDDFAAQIESALTERFENGKLALDDLPIQRILEILDENAHKNPEAQDELTGGPPTEKTLFRDPASTEAIEEAEKKLGVELPADYKEFLRLSNGFGAPFGGIHFEPALYPVADIRKITDEEDYFTDLTLELLRDVDLGMAIKEYDVTVGKAIEIGTEDIMNTWLIPPPQVAAYKAYIRRLLDGDIAGVGPEFQDKVRKAIQSFVGDGDEQAFWELEWGCLTWQSGGAVIMYGFAGFKAYLRTLAEDGATWDEDVLGREGWWGYGFVKGDGGGDEGVRQ